MTAIFFNLALLLTNSEMGKAHLTPIHRAPPFYHLRNRRVITGPSSAHSPIITSESDTENAANAMTGGDLPPARLQELYESLLQGFNQAGVMVSYCHIVQDWIPWFRYMFFNDLRF